MSGRWPPAGPGRAARRPDPYDAQFTDLHAAVGDLTRAITALAPKVLGSRLVALDAAGMASGSERVPFQALGIVSASASQLTVAAAPPAASAPGPGPGAAIVPPRGARVFNARAYAWTIYGGQPGDLVSVETFALPQPPNCQAGPLTGADLGNLALASDYPAGAVPVDADSGVQANAAATATLPGAAAKTTWLTGFEVTGAGATAALPVTVTVTGLAVTLHYIYSAAAGVLIENTPLVVEFARPRPASGPATPIAVSCPALGLGNTASAVAAHGYQL